MHSQEREPSPASPPDGDQERERRLLLLIGQLPPRFQSAIHWLRRPTARWCRIPAALLLMVGSVFSVLPILGLWMLPLGLVLLSEDVPLLRRGTGSILAWIERRHPRWLGQPEASEFASATARREGT